MRRGERTKDEGRKKSDIARDIRRSANEKAIQRETTFDKGRRVPEP